jgi:hypothetical protein
LSLILNDHKSQHPEAAERWRRNSAYSQKRQDIKEIEEVGKLLMEEYPAKANIPTCPRATK